MQASEKLQPNLKHSGHLSSYQKIEFVFSKLVYFIRAENTDQQLGFICNISTNKDANIYKEA